MLRQTHTFVHLELSPAAYAEIAGKLRAAGYDHAFLESEGKQVIDLRGIAVTPELANAETPADAALLEQLRRPPLAELQDAKPVVLYFKNEADREEFLAVCKEAMPNLSRAIKL